MADHTELIDHHSRVLAVMQRLTPHLAICMPSLDATTSADVATYCRELAGHLFTPQGSRHPRWIQESQRNPKRSELIFELNEAVYKWYQLACRWLAEMDSTRLRVGTLDDYRDSLNRHLRPFENGAPTSH
jgi:hypothetical protein